MIIRAKRKTNYTIISNVGLEDPTLSLKAKGMLAYLLTKPDDWKVNDRQLATIGPDGRTAVQAALKELEKAGYLRRERHKDETGKWSHISYVYDEPSDAEKPWTEKPATGFPATENPAIVVSTVGTSTVGTSTVKKRTASQPAQAQDISHALTPQQDLFGAICTAIGWNAKTLADSDKGQVAQASGILSKAGYSAEDVRRFMREVWAEDWRYQKKGQLPTLRQLRQEIGKLKPVQPEKVMQLAYIIDPLTGETKEVQL